MVCERTSSRKTARATGAMAEPRSGGDRRERGRGTMPALPRLQNCHNIHAGIAHPHTRACGNGRRHPAADIRIRGGRPRRAGTPYDSALYGCGSQRELRRHTDTPSNRRQELGVAPGRCYWQGTYPCPAGSNRILDRKPPRTMAVIRCRLLSGGRYRPDSKQKCLAREPKGLLSRGSARQCRNPRL